MAFTVTSYRQPVSNHEKHLLAVATAWASGKGSITINTLSVFMDCLSRERIWYQRDHPGLLEVPPRLHPDAEFGTLHSIAVHTPGSGRFFSVQ